MKYFIFIINILAISKAATLATVKFPSYQATSTTLGSNFVGLSMSLQQMYSAASNWTLLAEYIKNSWTYGTSEGSWGISLKVQWPAGYKYDCPTYTMINPTATCTVDIKDNFTQICNFFKSAGNNGQGLSIGLDIQGFDFNNPLAFPYLMGLSNNIMAEVGFLGFATLKVELFDKANLFASNNIRPGYTASDFLSEAMQNWVLLTPGLMGPGVTEDADPSWLDTYEQFLIGVPLGSFTVYSVPFKTEPELTIQNILSESYYQDYINQRFTSSSGVLDPTLGYLVITDLRMNPGKGVDGVTNSMASAIWALDFLLECARFGLTRVLLNVDFSTDSLQGPFGPAPDYHPRPIYYSLLLMSILASMQNTLPSFLEPTVLAGTSGNIKTYGFLANDKVIFILINKDTDPNASGDVQMQIDTEEAVKCIYMSADSLSSPTVTLAGFSFVGGNASPQGNYTEVYFKKIGNSHKVRLYYAEVALCSFTSPQYNFLEVAAHELNLLLLLGSVLLLFLL